MDLVAGIRKEGSRGGRGDFKWEDVRDSQHRENYLGHSLMAPVGRWQKNKDLNWYAKGDTSPSALSAAAAARKEEIRRIKEAEESALS
ncbi:kinase phosphorylation domain-containing protein, partial [Usnea florida]